MKPTMVCPMRTSHACPKTRKSMRFDPNDMGHGSRYELQSFKPNPIAVRYNHEVIGNTVDAMLSVNYDLVILEMGAHFPTDIDRLFRCNVKNDRSDHGPERSPSFDRFSRLMSTPQNNTRLRG